MAFGTGGDGGGGSIFMRKYGPLPLWAWMGLGLGAALAVTAWRRNRQAETDTVADDDGTLAQYELPETLQPTYVFQDADQYLVTVPEAPPGGGRPPVIPDEMPPPTMPTPTAPVKPTAPDKPKAKAKPPKPRAEYRAKKGDTLTKIAKKYGISVATLWKYNTTSGVRSAETIKTIKSRGKNTVYVNSLWLIPPKGWK